MIALALSALAGLSISALTSWIVVRAGVLDHPNARSAHTQPTPRGGGLAIMSGLGAGALVFAMMGEPGSDWTAILGASLAAGALGLADDLLALNAKEKFGILLGIAFAAAIAIGPVTQIDLGIYDLPIGYWVGIAGSALWIFTVINAINFMDGSDGLIVAALFPAGLGLSLITGDMMGVLLGVSLLGFAAWNKPRARLFLGDVGSLFVGAIFACTALAAVNETGEISVWIAPLLILPLLADVLLTLAAKLKAGKRLAEAHRSHAYQLRLRMTTSHSAVAGFFGFAAVILVIVGFGAVRFGGIAPLATFVAIVGVLTWYQYRIRSRAKAAGLDLNE